MITFPLRIGTASLVAPTIVAAVTACWFAFERQDWLELSPSFAGLALIAYPIMALFMLPIFLILWHMGRASFLSIAASGALITTVICLVPSLAMSLRHPLLLRSPTYSSYTDDSLEGDFKGAAWCGLFGLSIGAAFWVIAFSGVQDADKRGRIG